MPQRLLLYFLLLLPWALPAQQSTNARVLARAELGNTDITIGDQVWLEINISAPPNTTVAPLAEGFLSKVKGVEVMEIKPLNTVAEVPELLLQQRIRITSFDEGNVVIPSLPYAFRSPDGTTDTTFTNDLLLSVKALDVGEEDELQPIKGIIPEPLNIYDFWWVLLLALFGIIGYVTYSRFKASKRVFVPPPPPPADLRALNALKELEKEALWQKGNTKQYYSRLTRIFREYLSTRFDVSGMEMTSRQINSALVDKSALSANQLGEIRQLLQLSDLVKFAKATPEAELHVAGIERVRTFIRETGPEAEIVAPSIIASSTDFAPAAAPGSAGGREDEEKEGRQASSISLEKRKKSGIDLRKKEEE